MLIELLSMSNYGNYNIKLAHILGLESSIYLNELMNINEKALRKNKIDDNFFNIDRTYIEERTTISVEKQKDIEDNLIKIGILQKLSDNDNGISLNLTVLTSILASPDESLIKSISKTVKRSLSENKKKTKADAIKENLLTNIVTTNEELINAYSEWIDAVYTKEGWMSKKAVVCAQQVVDEFSVRNLDVALKVIEIATINGYRNMEWAVNAYKKDYNINYRVAPVNASTNITSTPQPVLKTRLSEEVF